MPHRNHSLGLAAIAVLAVTLAGCGEEGPAGADPTSAPAASSAPPAPPVPVTSAPVTEDPTGPTGPTGGTDVDLAALPDGPPPTLDVLLGSTLLHDGEPITLTLPKDAYVEPMGSYEGTPILATGVGLGTQFLTVADDGTTTPLGEPHDTYNYSPRLVPTTGHLLVPYTDRSTPLSVVVLDAETGAEVATLDEFSSLEPDDLAVADAWSGYESPDDMAAGISPDGSLALLVDSSSDVEELDPGAPVRVTVVRTDAPDEPVVRLTFAPGSGGPVFETDDAFLVVVPLRPGDDSDGVVVRCTLDGACERTTDPAPTVAIGGGGDLHFP